MQDTSVTRGNGLLEGFLARKRANMANRLIPATARNGRILDVGCGSHPFFLESTEFSQKHGIDKVITQQQQEKFRQQGIFLQPYDIEMSDRLPFEDDSFDVVTMLAVFEHIDPDKLTLLIREIHRILKPSGRYILTTPAGWTDFILKSMAVMRLVSSEEIDEHKQKITHSLIENILKDAGFLRENIKLGLFEIGMNLWATAIKE